LNGIVANFWDVDRQPRAGDHHVLRDPRLVVLLDMRGTGMSSLSLSPAASGGGVMADSLRRSPTFRRGWRWADFVNLRKVRHVDLHFETEKLTRQLMETIDPRQLEMPRMPTSTSWFRRLPASLPRNASARSSCMVSMATALPLR
jgi:hypothetical protein